MDFDNAELVEKYGSWIRVQVAFYDFMFMTASQTCAECFNHTAQFAEGADFYEYTVKQIHESWPTAEAAWAAFRESQKEPA